MHRIVTSWESEPVQLLHEIDIVADSTAVLLLGETGVGKSVARRLHRQSRRTASPWCM